MRKRSSLVVCLVGVFGVGTLIETSITMREKEREKKEDGHLIAANQVSKTAVFIGQTTLQFQLLRR